MATEANSPDEEWDAIVEESDDPEEYVAEDLDQVDYTDLTNLSRSVREQWDEEDLGIPTQSPGKDELIEAFVDAGVFAGGPGSDSEYYRRTEDGVVAVELLEAQDYSSSGGSSGPSPKTVLYCFTRQATTEEDLMQIRDQLEEAGYWIEASEGDGDKFMVRRDPLEEDLDADAVDAIESDSSDDEGESSESDEEAESEASDGSDEQSEDEGDGEDHSDLIPYEVARERLEEQNKPEVYAIAADEDVDNRSNMDKPELIDAVLEARVGDKVAPPEE